MKIVYLGAPGSGKDTLAKKFEDEYSYTILSTGSIFRKQASDGTKLGVMARDRYWGKGLLCPDNITNELVKNTVENMNQDSLKNIIFNGYPRSVDQAKFLDSITDISMVIDLSVDEDVAVKRLLSRGREDDLEGAIRKRFQEYREKTLPISEYYKNTGREVFVINANKTPESVFEEAFRNTIIRAGQ